VGRSESEAIRVGAAMRDIEDWKREQLKNIKDRAAYNALAEEFARAEKKIKARKKKRAPACAASVKPVPGRDKR
jgi:hypothetical protein